MMSMRVTVFLTILILATSRVDAQSEERKVTLSVGGGLPAARNITVEVIDSGEFRATGSGLPFTDSGLTTFEHRRAIGKVVSARLFSLANEAVPVWSGTGERWPDCKGATLEILGGTQRIYRRSGCITSAWLLHPSIRELLTSLDQLLPAGWTVSEVINY